MRSTISLMLEIGPLFGRFEMKTDVHERALKVVLLRGGLDTGGSTLVGHQCETNSKSVRILLGGNAFAGE